MGCRPEVLLKVLAASSEEVADRLPSGLSSVLERVPNTKFAERSVEPAGVAPGTPLRSDGAAVHTGLAVEPTQAPQTVFKCD